MKYAIIEGNTVKNTGTLQQLFPNVSFSTPVPNTAFLTDNNVVELIETLSHTTPSQKLTNVDPYLENGKAYNVKVETTTTDEQTALTNQMWAAIRAERDGLLKETDWRACSDRTLTDNWRSYRQALRDITTQSDPFNITFPEIPT